MQDKEVIVVNSPESSSMSFKEKLILSGLVTGVVGLTILGGIHLVKRASSNTQDKKALVPDSIEDKAKRINQTFAGAGTDVVRLRQIIRSISDKETFYKIAESYKKNYHSPLTRDMQGELYQTEYDEIMAIIAALPQRKGEQVNLSTKVVAWAKRLYAAMSLYYWIFPGTDEEAIQTVFMEIPTQSAYKSVQQAYKKEYGSDLEADLMGDIGFYPFMEYKQQIAKKPKA